MGLFLLHSLNRAMFISPETINDLVITLPPQDQDKVNAHIKCWQKSGKSIQSLADLVGVKRQSIYDMQQRGRYRLIVLPCLQRAFKAQLISDSSIEKMMSSIRDMMISPSSAEYQFRPKLHR